MNNVKSALLGQFTQIIELCFRVSVAGGNARLNGCAFAGTCISPKASFGW